MYLPQSAAEEAAQLADPSLYQKVPVAPVALTNGIKRTIEPQCRCSCEIGGTSAVALLVIHETCVETS